MSTDLDDLRRKAEAATPGPWIATHDGNREVPTVLVDDDGLTGPIAQSLHYTQREHCIPDAEFIAAANPAVVLDLLNRIAAVEKLHALVELNGEDTCSDCDCYYLYPCPTLKALWGES